jgi:hypothetical protein
VIPRSTFALVAGSQQAEHRTSALMSLCRRVDPRSYPLKSLSYDFHLGIVAWTRQLGAHQPLIMTPLNPTIAAAGLATENSGLPAQEQHSPHESEAGSTRFLTSIAVLSPSERRSSGLFMGPESLFSTTSVRFRTQRLLYKLEIHQGLCILSAASPISANARCCMLTPHAH